MNPRITEIAKLREELLNELQEIQNSCKHLEYHIGTYSWRVGAYDQMRICTNCGKCFEAPSAEELAEFIEEIEKPTEAYEKKRKEDCEKSNFVYVKSMPIGQGTKIYNRI